MANLRKVQNKGGQKLVSLPKDAREALGIEAGDYVQIDVSGGEVTINKARIVIDGAEG